MHAHYTIDTIKFINVDRMSTLNIAHQQLSQLAGRKGSLRLKQIQRRLEIKEVGISTQE